MDANLVAAIKIDVERLKNPNRLLFPICLSAFVNQIERMKIFLTVFATVVGGGLSFSLGQVLVRGMVEPSLELKRTIGRIAHDLEIYGDKIFDAELRPEFAKTFLGYSGRLREHLCTIIWYGFFRRIFALPPWKRVAHAAMALRGHSNVPMEPPPDGWRGNTDEIKRLLLIKL